MTCECDQKTARNYYRYYDTPDGCDIGKKAMVTARYGIISGLIFSIHDVLMYSRVVGLGPILKRCMYHTLPLGLMGATFGLVANSVQLAREKDDRLNYFLGGLACGPILASYLGSKHAILLGGLALGVAGMVKKDAIDSGTVLFPEIPSHMNSVRSWRHDRTWVKDPRDEMRHTCGKSK